MLSINKDILAVFETVMPARDEDPEAHENEEEEEKEMEDD
jgi:hypothetical protein